MEISSWFRWRLAGYAALLMAIVALSGCASSASWHPDNIGAACPAPVNYSKAEQKAVASELRACGERCRHTREMVKDYWREREMLRIARGDE